ncbi:MAG: glycosyltransferase family 4 protein [Elusimicrobiales bacterium]
MDNSRGKIFLISESVGWSGGATQMLMLAQGLARHGWEVVAICPRNGTLFARASCCGVRTINWQPFQDYDIAAALKLARLIDAEKPDIIHAHHPMAHAAGLAACYIAAHRAPFIVSRRVSHPLRRNLFSRFKYKSPRVSGYIAVAEAVAQILADYGIAREKITVVYSGVDETRFAPRKPDWAVLGELGFPDGMPIIGLIGNCSRDKGQHIFLAAAAGLLKQNVKAAFVCAGRDTDGEWIKGEARKLGLGEQRLRLLGFREDVPEIISVLSASVNAAIAGEAVSGSLRESMAMGVPVIASDIGGHREIIKDGFSGRIFPAGNASRLAEIMRESVSKRADALQMAGKALDFALANLTAAAMVAKTEQRYLELISRRAAHAESASDTPGAGPAAQALP